jgi:exonuclease III
MQIQNKCIQINLQCSRLATDSLLKIIEEENIDILCIQEPYTIQNKIAGLSKKYKIFTSGEGRNRAAIVVTNKQVETLLIKQLSDEDTVVLEVLIDNVKIILASIYFHISRQIETDLLKIEAIILHATGAGVLVAIDSNSRSTSWHDTLTNRRGRTLEEFLMSKRLHILNEQSDYTTVRSRRGTSNIDTTVISSQLLSKVAEWKISEQESCSDHSIVR